MTGFKQRVTGLISTWGKVLIITPPPHSILLFQRLFTGKRLLDHLFGLDALEDGEGLVQELNLRRTLV